MHRHRVPRIKQTFTFQGMTPGELLVIVGLFFAGYRIGGAIFDHPVAPFATGFLAYFLVFARLKAVLVRYPPGYFGNYLKWLGSKDLYYPLPDDRANPILANIAEEKPAEGQEEPVPLDEDVNRVPVSS